MRISDWSSDVCSSDLYIVLREALKRTHKVGLGQLALRGQEQLVALRPCGKGLVLEVLRYADEVNRAAGYFRDIGTTKPDVDLLDLAETDRKSTRLNSSHKCAYRMPSSARKKKSIEQ